MVVNMADNVEPMHDDEYEYYANKETSHVGMSITMKIAYIRQARQDDPEISQNWTEAEMLREMMYHEAAYHIAVFFGINPEEEDSLADRLRHTDFEVPQTLDTYLKRILGNTIPWG